MGMSGPDFFQLKELEDIKNQANKCTMGPSFSLIVRASKDDYASSQSDETRIRYAVVRTVEPDIRAENAELLKRLALYSNK